MGQQISALSFAGLCVTRALRFLHLALLGPDLKPTEASVEAFRLLHPSLHQPILQSSW